MHIFNVSISTVQSLKNIFLKVREDFITQSRYPVLRRPVFTISRMKFVQPGQKCVFQEHNLCNFVAEYYHLRVLKRLGFTPPFVRTGADPGIFKGGGPTLSKKFHLKFFLSLSTTRKAKGGGAK
jgi:hypothetical protein